MTNFKEKLDNLEEEFKQAKEAEDNSRINEVAFEILRLQDEIESRIDHYTPYRPITDTEEMQKKRDELWDLFQRTERLLG